MLSAEKIRALDLGVSALRSRLRTMEIDDAARRIAQRVYADAEFREADHPRDADGKFGSGGGGSSKTRPPFAKEHVENLPHPKDVAQPAKSWAQLKEKGDKGREQFQSALNKVAKSLDLRTDITLPEHLKADDEGNFLFVAPNKSEARATAKVEHDYGGDWSKLKDMIRASIVVDTVEDLGKAIDEVEAAGLKLAAKPKDKFTSPTAEGYRDLNTLVELPNGMIAELQYHVRSIIEAKNAGHSHYEEQQKLQRKNGSEEPNDKWSKEDRHAFDEARRSQKNLYEPAWERASKKGTS